MVVNEAQATADHVHPVHRVHRIGGAVLGLGLTAFGAVGLFDMPRFFLSREGNRVMGMGSNGALAVLSVLVGVALLAAALRGPRASSTTSIAVGALFLLSGFVHLAILDTAANVLAFRLPNVFFSFAVGVVLLALGAYGRVSGGLAPDNPYARTVEDSSGTPPDAGLTDSDLMDAEQAWATGHATAQQHQLLRESRAELAAGHYDRSWREYATTHTEAEVDRLRADSAAESASDHDR